MKKISNRQRLNLIRFIQSHGMQYGTDFYFNSGKQVFIMVVAYNPDEPMNIVLQEVSPRLSDVRKALNY